MTLKTDAISLTLRKRMILNEVTVTLPRAKATVIMGANGAGKSSLLSCLSGLRIPNHGRVMLDGQALATIPSLQRARRIGLLPQQADIHWEVNVRALVALGRLPYHDRWGRSTADDAAIHDAMVQTDCLHLADRKALRLSGGEQARVLLARVLAGQPDWILADEPFANLDPAHQLDAMACLTQAAQAGAGVVIVLHDLTQAARIADQMVIMKEGRILAAGSTSEVLTPAVLEDAFGVAVYIGKDESGAPVIAPMRRIR